jgi:hypothetical protein
MLTTMFKYVHERERARCDERKYILLTDEETQALERLADVPP